MSFLTSLKKIAGLLLMVSLIVACEQRKETMENTGWGHGNALWQQFHSQFISVTLPWEYQTDSALTFKNPMDTAIASQYLGSDSGAYFFPVARFVRGNTFCFIYGKLFAGSKSLALLTCDSSGTVLDQIDFFQDYLLDDPEDKSSVQIVMDAQGKLSVNQFLKDDATKVEPVQSFAYKVGEEGNIEDLNHVDQQLSEADEEVIPLP
ncbi:MAG: hypothetical protein MUF42_10095 [Cytophagaceae bacterium]|nr:hypothetical protein [Cytophagaceae bacterium]